MTERPESQDDPKQEAKDDNARWAPTVIPVDARLLFSVLLGFALPVLAILPWFPMEPWERHPFGPDNGCGYCFALPTALLLATLFYRWTFKASARRRGLSLFLSALLLVVMVAPVAIYTALAAMTS